MIRLILIGLFTALSVGCGAPTLETPECREARPVIREFYSYHFANEMLRTKQSLQARERFLTPDFAKRLESSPEGVDVFTTGSDDIPRAFREGKCETISSDRTTFNVLIFWRDDARTEQRQINVEAKKTTNGWLIDQVNY
ncbi:hypothetical protein BH24ACI3_BH24ACI3_00680 [soil metagenome]